MEVTVKIICNPDSLKTVHDLSQEFLRQVEIELNRGEFTGMNRGTISTRFDTGNMRVY